MNKENKIGFKWLEKLKNVKHIEIYIAIIFVIVLLLIFMSTKKTSTSNGQANNMTSLSVVAYVENMEDNLESILSKINGISEVSVMITLDMNNAEVSSSQINLSVFPEIKGIIITAKGLNNTSLKMKVLQAVEAVIDVKNNNIALLSSD